MGYSEEGLRNQLASNGEEIRAKSSKNETTYLKYQFLSCHAFWKLIDLHRDRAEIDFISESLP
jgi:hypothetical protein